SPSTPIPRRTTSSTRPPASGWWDRDRGDRGGGGTESPRAEPRTAVPHAQGGGPGLRLAPPGAGAVRGLLLLSLPAQLQADAVRDAARARPPVALRRPAPDHPHHHLDAVHPEPRHHDHLRDPR